MIRRDKFTVGDEIVWNPARIIDRVDQLGNRPLVITEVIDVPYESYTDYADLDDISGCSSNWEGMGHTQLLKVEGSDSSFSGAWFIKKELQ